MTTALGRKRLRISASIVIRWSARSRQDNLHRLAHGEHLRHQHLRQSGASCEHPAREGFERAFGCRAESLLPVMRASRSSASAITELPEGSAPS